MLEHQLEIKKYSELEKYISAFGKKQMNLVILVSRAGLGKTTMCEEILMESSPLILNSHITPLKFFQLVYERTQEEKDGLIIIDEAEIMFRNERLVTMLKILCDTKTERSIRYSSSSPLLKDYPQEFTTQAKVMLLLNTLNPKDENIRAVMSRGHLINFSPPDTEILEYLRSWATDKEILNYIGNFAPFSKSLNLRTYVLALESKKSRLDWRAEIVKGLNIDPRLVEIQRLLQKYPSDKKRIEEFEKLGHGSRLTYYRYKKLFLSKNSQYKP